MQRIFYVAQTVNEFDNLLLTLLPYCSLYFQESKRLDLMYFNTVTWKLAAEKNTPKILLL